MYLLNPVFFFIVCSLKIIEGYALKEGKSVNLVNDNSEGRTARLCLSISNTDLFFVGSLGLFRALYELVWQVIKGGIKKESLFPAISQILVCKFRWKMM